MIIIIIEIIVSIVYIIVIIFIIINFVIVIFVPTYLGLISLRLSLQIMSLRFIKFICFHFITIIILNMGELI